MASDPAWLSIVDKPLTNGATTVVLTSRGTLEGDGIEGTWEEGDGRYCRTLVRPARLAGTECQDVELDGDEVRFDNRMGRTSTWTVQEAV